MHVGVAVIPNYQGKILIGRRAAHKPSPGLWEFPGGKLEADEDLPACIRRELLEELSLPVEPLRELTRYQNGSLTLHFWLCEAVDAQSLPLRDHDALAWVELKELLNFDIVQGSLPFAQQLAEQTEPLQAREDI